MNTRSGYVIDDTADLQSTRHLTQATSCRTIREMPFLLVWKRTLDKPNSPSPQGHFVIPTRSPHQPHRWIEVKARSAAIISLKTIIVTAAPELREQLQGLPRVALIERCAGLRPGTVTSVLAATKHTLRATARRWVLLNTEVLAHEKILTELTKQVVPDLVTAHGIGPDTASEMLIVAGDNAARVRSEPAWARLLGVAPVPASSGLTNRHRLNRGGHRQANAALYRAVIVRMQFHEPSKAYVARRTAEGKTKREIIRCLKRLLAREIWTLMKPFREASVTTAMAAWQL